MSDISVLTYFGICVCGGLALGNGVPLLFQHVKSNHNWAIAGVACLAVVTFVLLCEIVVGVLIL